MADIARAGLLIVPRIDGLERSVNAALKAAEPAAGKSGAGIGEKVGSGFGRGLGGSGAAIGAFSALTAKAMDSVSAHVGDAVSRFDTLNQYPKTMELLGYSSEAAQASIQTMSDRLASLPTRLDDMVGTVQGIVAVTGDLDQATSVGLALNDMLVASGSNAQLTTAAMEQFRQMLAKGKPELEDWKSLTGAMPGQMGQLAKAMLGPTANANDLYRALGGGGEVATLTMGDLMDAMVRLDTEGGDSFTSFREQAETASGGVQTSISNMQNAVTKGLAGTLDAIGKDSIAGAFNDIKGAISDAFSTVNSVVGRVAPVFREVYEAVRPIAPVLVAAAGGLAAWKGASGLLSGVAGAASDLFSTLRGGAGAIGSLAKGVSRLPEALSLAAGGAGTLGESLGAVGLTAGTVASGIGAVVGVVAVVGGVVAQLYSDWKERQDNLTKSTEGLSDAVSDTAALSGYKGTIDEVGQSAGTSAMSVDELAESTSKAVDRMNENTAKAEEQIAQLNTAQGVIDQYAGQTDLSAEAQGRLRWAIQLVNDELGLSITQQDVMNDSYTDASGNVVDLTDSIDGLIAKKKEEARVSAVTANLTEAYKAQADASKTLAERQKAYNDTVDGYMERHPEWSRDTAEAAAMTDQVGRDLKSAEEQYDSATDSVGRLEGQLGEVTAAASDAAGAFDSWAAGTGPLFSDQLAQNGTSIDMLKEDLRGLGANTEDLSKLSTDELKQLAESYDGTTASIVGRLDEWGVGMDGAARQAALSAADMESALSEMGDGVADAFSEAGLSSDGFAEKLSAAGVSTGQLNAVGSDNLAELARNCNGNLDLMVWAVQHYNDTPILDKDGNVSVEQTQLVDAQGNVYEWNGSALKRQDGQAVVDGVSLVDAQGNVVTWNGSSLNTKWTTAEVGGNLGSALQQVWQWNNSSLRDLWGSATMNIRTLVESRLGSGNAAGGIRTHADGGIVPRFHGGGAIATKAVPLDVVGEAGAEAIVPLTNRRYSQPFADVIAEGLLDALRGSARRPAPQQTFNIRANDPMLVASVVAARQYRAMQGVGA